MPTRMFNDGGEYSHPKIFATAVHTRADCGHVQDVGVLLEVCKVNIRLSHDEVDRAIKALTEAKVEMLDQVADFDEEAEADDEQADDEG